MSYISIINSNNIKYMCVFQVTITQPFQLNVVYCKTAHKKKIHDRILFVCFKQYTV